MKALFLGMLLTTVTIGPILMFHWIERMKRRTSLRHEVATTKARSLQKITLDLSERELLLQTLAKRNEDQVKIFEARVQPTETPQDNSPWMPVKPPVEAHRKTRRIVL